MPRACSIGTYPTSQPGSVVPADSFQQTNIRQCVAFALVEDSDLARLYELNEARLQNTSQYTGKIECFARFYIQHTQHPRYKRDVLRSPKSLRCNSLCNSLRCNKQPEGQQPEGKQSDLQQSDLQQSDLQQLVERQLEEQSDNSSRDWPNK